MRQESGLRVGGFEGELGLLAYLPPNIVVGLGGGRGVLGARHVGADFHHLATGTWLRIVMLFF